LSAQRILVSRWARGQSGQTLEATFFIYAVLMQVEPTVMETLGAFVDVQTSAVKGSSVAAAAGRYQLANKGSVGVDASAVQH